MCRQKLHPRKVLIWLALGLPLLVMLCLAAKRMYDLSSKHPSSDFASMYLKTNQSGAGQYFHVAFGSDLNRHANYIASITFRQLPTREVLWELASHPADGESQGIRECHFSYGEIPSGFTQEFPQSGIPRPLVAGEKFVVDVSYQYDRLAPLGACAGTTSFVFFVGNDGKVRMGEDNRTENGDMERQEREKKVEKKGDRAK